MNKILFVRSICTVLLICLAGALQAQTRYVKEGGTGDGSSWANASGDLQSMMNAAANGGTVYVAGGTYYPTTTTDRTKAFLFPQAGNVKMFGGYNAATGIRNITANPTILSGNLGLPADNTDNSYHVLVIAGTSAGADSIIVDGFTVTKGYANGNGAFNDYNATGIANDHGGGICVVTGGNVAIRNTIISGNFARYGGGGMFNHYSSPVIEDCTLGGNEVLNMDDYYRFSNFGGGAMYNKYAGPLVNRTTIKGNFAFSGGGMLNYAGTPKFNNCLFDNNTSSYRGGAVTNYCPSATDQSRPVFGNCVFINNSAGSGGVGYDNYKASPTYNNCVFIIIALRSVQEAAVVSGAGTMNC